ARRDLFEQACARRLFQQADQRFDFGVEADELGVEFCLVGGDGRKSAQEGEGAADRGGLEESSPGGWLRHDCAPLSSGVGEGVNPRHCITFPARLAASFSSCRRRRGRLSEVPETSAEAAMSERQIARGYLTGLVLAGMLVGVGWGDQPKPDPDLAKRVE